MSFDPHGGNSRSLEELGRIVANSVDVKIADAVKKISVAAREPVQELRERCLMAVLKQSEYECDPEELIPNTEKLVQYILNGKQEAKP